MTTFNRFRWTAEDARKLMLREIVYLRPDPDLDDLVGMDEPPKGAESEAS